MAFYLVNPIGEYNVPFDDTELRGLISAEATARIDADATLYERIGGKQDRLTPGANISIVNNVISATLDGSVAR